MSAPSLSRAALAACGLVIGLVAGRAADIPKPKFAIGVLRRDGIVIPFAVFDGKHWRNHWPAPKDHVDVPVTVKSVPKWWWGSTGPLDTWQAWVGSETPQTLKVKQLDWYEAQCSQQVGLRTDYRSSQPPPGPKAQPYPKDGLAVSPPQSIERIGIMPPGPAAPEVVAAFNEAERNAFSNIAGETGLVTRIRELQPLKSEAVYASRYSTGTNVYYLEVSRQYDNPKAKLEPGIGRCGIVSFGAGWFTRDGEGPLKSLAFDVAVVSCHRDPIHYMLPLGGIRIADRFFWLAQWSGWGYEEYTVVEITPKKAEHVLRTGGGGC